MDQRLLVDDLDSKNCEHTRTRDAENPVLGRFDKRLPCFGFGIGWCCFLLGFVCPLTWYFAAILYFVKYFHKDPRERSGLSACVIAAFVCTLIVMIIIAIVVFT